MSRKVHTIITYTDDLTGEELDEKDVRIIQFKLTGVGSVNATYEIDLSPHNALTFAKTLEPYIVAGRLVSGKKRQVSSAAPRNRSSSTTIRRWAQRQGLEVAPKGRIPADVKNAYMEAHK